VSEHFDRQNPFSGERLALTRAGRLPCHLAGANLDTRSEKGAVITGSAALKGPFARRE
jgi:hypothetical protein